MIRVPSQRSRSPAHSRHARCLRAASTSSADVIVMGDLHLKDDVMSAFMEARSQMKDVLQSNEGSEQMVVQLGDVGTGPTSGSPAAFEKAREFLTGFDVPFRVITGNHDLEGTMFDSDEANLAAWQEAWGQHHCWAHDAGPAVLIGISTTRYRSNEMSHHEVHVDAAQRAWLRRVLRDVAPDKPAVLFSHAPPMGCGLKVIHNLHVKNRCAWLNHSSAPHEYMQLLADFPRIRAWFSGHFHLSHNYADSIVGTAGCAFVQTGVIGPHCNRDGERHSRLLRLSPDRCKVYTIDHDEGGRTRLDVDFAWADLDSPVAVTPDEEIVCDVSAGYVCARDLCSVLWHDGVKWWPIGETHMLALQDSMLLEYDTATFAPTGAVTLDVAGAEVRLLDNAGQDVTSEVPYTGACVSCIQLVDPSSREVQQEFPRNEWGTFFQVFQPNKWKLKRAQLAAGTAARETVML